ncbi:MAG: hypothetical protein QM757_33465 [Paludibaculum sp.]
MGAEHVAVIRGEQHDGVFRQAELLSERVRRAIWSSMAVMAA